MSDLRVLVAMHDVAPFHRQRLERAEALLAAWGVKKVLYLLVPNYHGAQRADHDPRFLAWCRRPRPFDVQWFLHGYFHLCVGGSLRTAELESPANRARITGALPAGSPRSDESEFARLSVEVNRERLQSGRAVFRRCLGMEPAGFVAPKWMGNRNLDLALDELGFEWTEDDRSIHAIRAGRKFSAPAITWATRSWWRKQSSLWGCPLLAALWQRTPLVRIALHPFDFDHPAVVASIARIVDKALSTRRQAFYPELLELGSQTAAA